jgi:hypothetical protein
MTDKLERLLKYLVARKEYLDTPVMYQEEEYYNDCQAKSNMLEEVIDEVKSLIKETDEQIS